MSKTLSGLFDSFDNLDQIPIEGIARWLKPQPQLNLIENYLAQRILYPQTVPITVSEMKIDLAILREALRLMLGDNPFLNTTLRKILIPLKLLAFVPNLETLALAFVDGLLSDWKKHDFFEDLWTIVLTDETDEIIGSLVLPEFKDSSGFLQLTVAGKTYSIHAGEVTFTPCPSKRCEVAFRVKLGKILNKENLAIEVYGGRLGLMIDGRSR